MAIFQAGQDCSLSDLEAEVVIVGAGPAGLATAFGLASSGRRVMVIESGGFTPMPDYGTGGGRVRGSMPYHNLSEGRARGLGGSSALWGGWIVPLSDLDFETRPDLTLTGWCMSRRSLDPYYRRALSFIGVPDTFPYQDWSRANEPAFRDSPFVTRSFPAMGRLQLGNRHAELFTMDSVDLVLGATVKRIVTIADGSAVDHVVVGTAGGDFVVTADVFVLSTGGIENPRILLASANKSWPNGLGNAHDLVGRYFMEHPHVDAMRFQADPGALDTDFFTTRPAGLAANGDPMAVNGALALSEEFCVAHGIGGAELFVERAGLHTKGRIPLELDGQPRPLRNCEYPANEMALITVTEQVPNPNSRVMLGDTRDRYEIPHPVLQWELGEIDIRTVHSSVDAATDLLLALGVKEVRKRLREDEWPDDTIGGIHHLGTTRMAHSPAEGVVDADCRVHDIHNLYIAGGSVFPTSGYAPPTLTITALALRLADHLVSAGA
ncbi:GMC family oxidoreductase [Streptomyces sp. NPDC004237]|uniref:GMC family oxidoreductase n=1 Tax=Streptomyces sp. NPDC004237 TaxID=3154455 RepID=UPI0033A10AB3